MFLDVEIRVGFSVGDAMPGADDVLVADRVGVWVAPPDGTCVAVGVRVLVGVGVSDGGGTGVDVGGGAVTVNDPFDKLKVTLVVAPGSVAAALPRDNGEVPGAALALTLKMMFATTPSGITS